MVFGRDTDSGKNRSASPDVMRRTPDMGRGNPSLAPANNNDCRRFAILWREHPHVIGRNTMDCSSLFLRATFNYSLMAALRYMQHCRCDAFVIHPACHQGIPSPHNPMSDASPIVDSNTGFDISGSTRQALRRRSRRSEYSIRSNGGGYCTRSHDMGPYAYHT